MTWPRGSITVYANSVSPTLWNLLDPGTSRKVRLTNYLRTSAEAAQVPPRRGFFEVLLLAAAP
jgi:hypothetical protein